MPLLANSPFQSSLWVAVLCTRTTPGRSSASRTLVGRSPVSRCSGTARPSASCVRHDALVSSARSTTRTSGAKTSRSVSRADATTSARSSESGSVRTTSCSAWNRSLASAMRPTSSAVSRSRSSASSQSWRVYPPTTAAAITTIDASSPVRNAPGVAPSMTSAIRIVPAVNSAAKKPSRYPQPYAASSTTGIGMSRYGLLHVPVNAIEATATSRSRTTTASARHVAG